MNNDKIEKCLEFPYSQFQNNIMDIELVTDNKVFDDVVVNKIYELRDLIINKKPDTYPGIITNQFPFYLSRSGRNMLIKYLQSLLNDSSLSNNIKVDIEKLITNIKKIIFQNTFDSYAAAAFYIYIKNHQYQSNEAIIFSHNTSILETFADYVTYDLNENPQIKYYLSKETIIQNQHIIDRYRIKTVHLDLNYIDQLISESSKTPLIIIDATIKLGSRGDSYIYRLTYAFQMIFSILLLALNMLDIGGSIHIVMPPMGKYFIIDMMQAIITMFKSFETYDVPHVCFHDAVLLNNYVMSDFIGINTTVITQLRKLISIYQQIDQTDGYAFTPSQNQYP